MMLKNLRLCLSGLLMVLLLSSYVVADDEMDHVKQAIAAKGAKWHAAQTTVSKLSHEKRKMKLGLNKAQMPRAPLLAAPAPSTVAALPGAFDWRNYNGGNFVTPVRDQGQCGSCWAFATTATLESSMLIKNNTPGMDLNLAEQILVSCSGAGNCSGGSSGSASNFIKNTGLPPEAFDNYSATDATCSSAIANWQASTYKISSWSYVATTAPTVDAIKNALNTYGPVNTTMEVYSDFYYYTSGIYHYTTGTHQGGHVVLIVGYDDTNEYFICKNSWGTWWGEGGFFRIAYSELNSVTQFGDYTIAYQSGTSQPPPQTWTVTPSAGSNGTISPSTPQTINNGSTTSFTVTPVAGYRASGGGTCGGTLNGITYITNPITANCTVTATFTATPVNGQCGSANGKTFTSAPISDLCSSGTASSVTGNGPWIWSCAGSTGGSTASCQANQAIPQAWAVTGSVTGGNGTISCTTPVNHGLSATCTITPNKGYRLATLTDNGNDVESQVVGNSYIIPTVTTNHTVIASFATPPLILWRNISTGENTVWYMDGSTHTNTATLESLTGAWRMVATADFNSDGNPDILWRNVSTGANMVWYMNGATHTGSADLAAVIDQNWKIAGVADFNSDGNPDILWRNMSTGANMVWYMKGMTQTGSADLTPVADQDWKIVGTTDLNHDGKPDILWRNYATGQNVVWYMEGTTRKGVAFLDTVADLDWKMIGGTTDLNHDGKPDILWRNTATGANRVWYMDGITYTAAFLDPVTDQNMEIAGQGNYSAPPPPPLNGQCGSSHGGTFTTPPTINFCTAGNAGAVSGTGPWTWSCEGLYGGTTASCQANIKTWTVTPSAESNDAISPNTPQTVNHGATTSFTIIPNAQYAASVGGTCGGSPSSGSASFTYITNPITADCTVVATFTPIVVGVCGSAHGGTFTSAPTTNLCSVGTASGVTGSGPWIWTCQAANGTAQCQANPQTWTVTGSVTGGNGIISCTSPVNQGVSSTCTLTPNAGYRLATLTDNASDVTGEVAGNVYAIPTVTANHKVIASFVTRGAMMLWRNISTGENTVWYTDGSTHTATATLKSLTGSWRMVATADFNNDGEADILWRNMSTGANMVWYMNGATQIGSADLDPVTDQNWKIVGVAGFNSDGNPDILWRNISTGANRVWYMNGITQTGSADLTPVTDQSWKIAGVADFNSDGSPDILWRSSTTGQNVVWYMEGTTRKGVAFLDTVTDQNWKMIAGTTDLNHDGKPDILWRNTATGANMVWYMSGITYTAAMLDTVTDQNMEIAGQGNN